MTLNTQQLGSCNHPLQQHVLRNGLQSVSYYLHLRNFRNVIDIVRADKLLSGPFWGHACPTTCGVVCAEGAWGTTGDREELPNTSSRESLQGHRHAEWHRCPRQGASHGSWGHMETQLPH